MNSTATDLNSKTWYGSVAAVWPQIEFHWEKVYEDFELFIKVTIAIAGGIAYLATQDLTGIVWSRALLMCRLGAVIDSLAALVTVYDIVSHHVSAKKRYDELEKTTGKSPVAARWYNKAGVGMGLGVALTAVTLNVVVWGLLP